MFVENFIYKLLNISKYSICAGVLLLMSQNFFAISNPAPKPGPMSTKRQLQENTEKIAMIAVIKEVSAKKPTAIPAEKKPKLKPGWPE